MDEAFEARNELEEKLLAYYRKEIDFALLIQTFLASKVAIALDAEVDEMKPNLGMNPLCLQSPKGYMVLTAFSSPERINALHPHIPNYTYSLVTDCRWYLKGITEEVGFALNPGWPIGFEMDPEHVQKFKRDFGIR